MITAIGTAMIAVLTEGGYSTVMWGDAGNLDSAYARSGAKSSYADSHPLNRWHYVLNTLARDSRFEKGFIRIDLFIGNAYRKRLVRSFTLKETSTCPTIPN